MKTPGVQISAIIPSYNHAEWLPCAIDSVLSQSYPVAEVLIIDDGSTDNTNEVAARYGHGVRYVYQENRGLSGARNTGIHLAQSPWVALLDSDDWWLPEKIERQVEELERNPEAVLVYSALLLVRPDGTRTVKPAADPGRLWPTLRYRNLIAPSSVLARRDVLLQAGGFDETLHACEDWDMWVRLGPDARFAAVFDPLTAYQLTPMSMSTEVERMLHNTESILEKSLLGDLRGWRRTLWRRRIWSAELFRASVSAREARQGRSLGFLLRSLGQWPSPFFLPRRWVALLLHFLPGR